MDYKDYSELISSWSLKDITKYVTDRVWKGNYNFALALYDRLTDIIAPNQNISVSQEPRWEELFTFLFSDQFLKDSQEQANISTSDKNVETTYDNSQPEGDDDNERWRLADQKGGADEVETEEEGPVNIDHHLEISEEYQIESKRLKTSATQFRVNFRNLDSISDILELVRAAFQRLLDQTFQQGDPTDRIGIEIRHPGLHHRPIFIPFLSQKQLSVEKLLRIIERTLQSNDDFRLDDEVTIIITRIRTPVGSGPSRKEHRGNFKQWMKAKSGPHGGCFLHVKNEDELCMARVEVLMLYVL